MPNAAVPRLTPLPDFPKTHTLLRIPKTILEGWPSG